jgi:hypothetical protein
VSTPAHEIMKQADSNSIVRVGRNVAGFISQDAERPGLWIVEDPDGRFMGRHLDHEAGAAFLAAWFAARDDRDG